MKKVMKKIIMWIKCDSGLQKNIVLHTCFWKMLSSFNIMVPDLMTYGLHRPLIGGNRYSRNAGHIEVDGALTSDSYLYSDTISTRED